MPAYIILVNFTDQGIKAVKDTAKRARAFQAENPELFNHLVRPRQDVRRNRQSDLFGRLQIDDEFKLHRPLYRQIGRLCPFENLVHKVCGTSVHFGIARRIGH